MYVINIKHVMGGGETKCDIFAVTFVVPKSNFIFGIGVAYVGDTVKRGETCSIVWVGHHTDFQFVGQTIMGTRKKFDL